MLQRPFTARSTSSSHCSGTGPGLVLDEGMGLVQWEKWILVPVLVLDQCEHFCLEPIDPSRFPCPSPSPSPVQCGYTYC